MDMAVDKPEDTPESALADAIYADGMLRLCAGKEVHLERYLRAMPDLESHAEALDAAISVALAWLKQIGCTPAEAVAVLCARHAGLTTPIRIAAALNAAVEAVGH